MIELSQKIKSLSLHDKRPLLHFLSEKKDFFILIIRMFIFFDIAKILYR